MTQFGMSEQGVWRDRDGRSSAGNRSWRARAGTCTELVEDRARPSFSKLFLLEIWRAAMAHIHPPWTLQSPFSYPFQPYGHWQVLFVILRSVIVPLVVPGGVCKLAVPVFALVSAFPNTRRSAALCVSVQVFPCLTTVPFPTNTDP